MIYLSAQPDDFYFTWQIEIQLFNFRRLGIAANNIHVLISYEIKRGVRQHWQDLIEANKNNATFYCYPDKREKKEYASSLRPHIIQQHFSKYSWLEHEIIFYHDSDIIFRELPNFKLLGQDNSCYVSDTRNYLDSTYIKQFINDDDFSQMCDIVGVLPCQVIENDQNCGGAQYLLKNISSIFWGKVENDCESLYSFLVNHNALEESKHSLQNGDHSEYAGIQAWCTDMWCMFWNLLVINKEVKIANELNFCWAVSDIASWEKSYILHYSGNVSKNNHEHFRKANYLHFPPYFDFALKKISTNSASYALVKVIEEFKNENNNKKINLLDVTFLIPIKVDSTSRLENLYSITNYLAKYFNTTILLGEFDENSKIEKIKLPPICTHFFVEDVTFLMHHTKINNFLISKAQTNIIAIYDTDIVLPINQIIEATNTIRNNQATMVSPYDGSFINIDSLFKVMFGKLLDPDLFTVNINKFFVSMKRSWGGCVFLSKSTYLTAGLDNEYISSWGPEDIERPKRLKNLGYEVKRIDGPLFHLTHDRLENSSYFSQDLYYTFMEEYLNVCNMDRFELENYIQTWPWVKGNYYL